MRENRAEGQPESCRWSCGNFLLHTGAANAQKIYHDVTSWNSLKKANMHMGAAAEHLGVSRTTLWRMIREGRLQKVEVLPRSFRIRRGDLEAIASAKER
jgi:excisionase family DNA binding protein